MRYKPSFAIRLTSSLFLSSLYFTFAVGIWAVGQNQFGIQADSVHGTCTASGTTTDTFNNFPTDGSVINPPGWAPDPGQSILGWDMGTGAMGVPTIHVMALGGTTRIVSTLPTDTEEQRTGLASQLFESVLAEGGYPIQPTTLAPIVRATKTLTPSTEGTIRLKFYPINPLSVGVPPGQTASEYNTSFSLLLKNQQSMSFRISRKATEFHPNTNLPKAWKDSFEYFDLVTNQYREVMPATPISPFPAINFFQLASHTEFLGAYADLQFDVTLKWTGGNSVTVTGDPATGLATGAAVSHPITMSSNEPTSVVGLALTGGNWLSIEYPTGISVPCLSGVTPSSVQPGGQITITGINFTSSGNTVTVGGKTLANLPSNGTSIAVTLPADITAGSTTIQVANSKGSSGTLPLTIAAPTPTPTPTVTAATQTGTNLVCAGSENVTQTLENFELYTDGQTKDFGWTVQTYPSTVASIKKDSGNPGKALQLVDTNTASGYQAQVLVTRAIRKTDSGSISFDVKPSQTTGRFAATLAGEKGSFLYIYLSPTGTFEYWNDDVTTGSKYIRLGTDKDVYTKDQWLTVTLDWIPTGFTMKVNGKTLNSEPLAFSYPKNVTPAEYLSLFTGWEAATGFTGTYAVDNVSYPGCGTALGLSAAPASGTVPFTVTASVTMPFLNVLNQASTEVNDVGAATDAKQTIKRNPDTGALEITDVPLAATCTSKSWLYDLDQHKINQLRWLGALPQQSVIHSTISWDTSDTETVGGMMVGGIGLVDNNGLFYNFVGLGDDTGAQKGSYGVLFGATRNNTTEVTQCGGSYGDNRKGGAALTTPTGTADLKIVRNGTTYQLFINDLLVTQQEVTGEVAGLGLGTAGFPGFNFGTFQVNSLTIQDLGITWDYGDGSETFSTTNATTQHTYAKAGAFPLKVTVGGVTASVSIMAKTLVVQTTPVTTASSSGTASSASGSSASSSASTTTPSPTPTQVPTVVPSTTTSPTPLATAVASVAPPVTKAPTVAPKSTLVQLVSTGGSLTGNLLIAVVLSLITTFLFLRRSSNQEDEVDISAKYN